MGVTRAFRLGWDVAKRNISLPGLPYKLIFAVTYHCNSRCKLCGIWKKRPENELSLEEIREIGRKNRFIKWLNITGGEPFLRRDIVEIAKAFPSLLLLNITTNSLVPGIAGKVAEMMDAVPGKVVVTLSLDGPPWLHDKLRGIPGNFDKVMERYLELKPLKRKGLGLYFGFTLSKLNYEHLWETIDEARQRVGANARDFHINIFHYSGHYYGNERLSGGEDGMIRTVKEFMECKKSWNPVDLMDYNYLSRAEEWIRKGRTPMKCMAMDSSVFMDPEGNVFPCTIYSRKIGNVRESGYDIGRMLARPDSRELRKGIEKGKCPQCWTPCEAYQMIASRLWDFRLPI